MIFAEGQHITRDELAKRYGKRGGVITNTLRKNALLAVGLIRAGGVGGYKGGVPYYDAAEAVRILDAAFLPVAQEAKAAGEIVPPRSPGAFRPLRTAPHPRQADIDAAQPPVATVSMGGIGNGAERVFGYGRGR